MSRVPELIPEKLSPEQRRVYDAIASGPRGVVQGPLRVWLQSAELADRAQALGAFCRFGTSLPPRLSELAIITTGAYWRAGFEWHVHAPIAVKAGVPEDAVEAIRAGKPARFVKSDEAAVHAFASELLETRRVSEATYQRAVTELGIKGVVELVGVLGYYGLISMTINAFEVPVPAGAKEPFAER
ncbi:MAG TPA: carboxymuconolactone decarboxylase family protein [Xanthobacteraceae bacterium]|jgi:4-carboxymuconolactone decarboxylase|nr:carboxymuconolactone decarboxylase family protein [Xanthobacteraceae bacterium]